MCYTPRFLNCFYTVTDSLYHITVGINLFGEAAVGVVGFDGLQQFGVLGLRTVDGGAIDGVGSTQFKEDAFVSQVAVEAGQLHLGV
jgi:hypothetical protein